MREICGGRGELVFGVEGCLCVVAFEGGRGGRLYKEEPFWEEPVLRWEVVCHY